MATREQTYSPPAAPDSHEPAITQVLTRAYTLNWEAIAYGVILAVALVTRLVELGVRVMSHDESLHTYYSWRLYEFGEFNHTPLMHGPLLFHMTALSYFLFGDSDFTARIYPALLGVAIVLMPVLFRRWLGRTGALVTAVMLLISPQLLYYSRYIRHDIPTIFFALLLLYAALQYIDGTRPRRPVWLWVIAGALLGMLASKEVAFIYIALFGSFMTLYWLFRMMQDVGVAWRPAMADVWQPPALQLAIGHALLLAVVLVIVVTTGGFLRYLISPVLWTPSDAWFDVPLFIALYLPLAGLGLLRSALAGHGERREGVASAIMQGLARGKSALWVITAGVIIGAAVALLIVCVVDIIKPDQVWTQQTVMSVQDRTYGTNVSKEYATAVAFDSAMFVRLATWIMLPTLGLLFVVFLTAVFKYPGDVPLPWREILLVALIALVVTSGLVMLERRSFVAETGTGPFAVDPNATAELDDGGYDNTPLLVAWVLGALVTAAIWATRLLTNWWDFLNRQPLFDVLIVIGTLILPWLAAFPLYWAGYNLEDYNPNSPEGRDTLEAALPAVIPFALVSISAGLAWNWRRWLPAGAIFIGLFAFFFTTVFSNQYGLVTGMIGSLGYWLEQQGVRRGSQPQYYYMLTQLPVYEFLPMIGASLAGIAGLNRLWAWRRERTVAARNEALAAYEAAWDARARDEDAPEAVLAGLHKTDPLQMDVKTEVSSRRRTEEKVPDRADAEDGEPLPEDGTFEYVDEPFDPDADPWDLAGRKPKRTPKPDFETPEIPDLPQVFELPERLARAYSVEEEQARRDADPEWIGPFPFLALVGYWAITIIFGLTVAGEKMPWLTVHLTVPLILASGWWLGTVVDGIAWSRLRDGGWLVLLVALPLAFMALFTVLRGLWGDGMPFQSRAIEDLVASGNWLAAVLVLAGALYLVGRFGNRLGLAQLGRMAIVSGAVLLAIVTARAAYMASFLYYDYATEYLVYAHAGPAIKTVLDEVDRLAELTNEGSDMRIVFDDESSWPYTWYFRDYPNYGFLRGEAGSVMPSDLDGARVIIVGNKKAGDVRRILADRYYEFSYIRLWWPMQEYFNLNFDRVANVFSGEENNIAAEYFREGLWDIWWDRDYSTYAQAMCIEGKQARCDQEAAMGVTPDEREQFRATCEAAVIAECRGDDRFAVSKWPVSDRMYFFVDKTLAAQIWDAGIGSSTVDIREPEYPEDRVFTEIEAEAVFGEGLGLNAPRGIAASEGLLYIADTDNNRVLVVTPDGEVVRSIGDEILLQPWGVDVGADGLVYVADTWNHQVKVFTQEGELRHAWGHHGVLPGDTSLDALWGPRDIAVGPEGLVYVADTGNKRVRVFTPEGEWVRDIGSGGSNLGQVDEPVGLAFNPVSGHLYVAEAWNRRVQAFFLDGMALRTFEVNMWFRNQESFNRPYLAVSPDGSLLYVSDMDDGMRVVAYNLEGVPVLSFNQPDNLEANRLGLRSPAGLATDAQGRLYVVDAEQASVYIFALGEIQGEVQPAQPFGAEEDEPGVELPADENLLSEDDASPEDDASSEDDVAPDDDSLADESPAVEADVTEEADAPAEEALPESDDGATPDDGAPVEEDASPGDDEVSASWSPVSETIKGLPVVYVPAGCVEVGADGPLVCLTDFWISQTEITHAQYMACVDAGACDAPQDRTFYGNPAYADAPVVMLDHVAAEAFAEWVGASLPTEAQWAYAARGPASLAVPWGDAPPTCALANTAGCGGLLPVGADHRLAGESWVGARDMVGSVWEWTADWFAADTFAAWEKGATDPTGPAEGDGYAVRGGAWNVPAEEALATSRESRAPDQRDGTIGFRVVFPADALPAPLIEG